MKKVYLKKSISAFLILGLIVWIISNLSLLILAQDLTPEEQARIQKVLQTIEMMERAALDPKPRALKQVILTEEELNAYIAYRLRTEPVEWLQELQLKLLNDNCIEGKAVFDLSQENLPNFIPKKAVFFFSALFQVKENKIYFEFKKVFLGSQELNLDFVSEIIKQIALAHNAVPEGLNRSYDLPFGIKDIKSRKGLAIFYY